MSRIVFVGFGSESMGIASLSSYLKKEGHDVFLAFDPGLFDDRQLFHFQRLNRFLFSQKKFVKKILSFNPDIILFSVFTQTYQWSLNIAKQIKRYSSVPIVFGGIHATSVPEIVMKESVVDYVIVGEGEVALFNLLKSLDKPSLLKTLKNTYYRLNNKVCFNGLYPLIKNLDELPFQDKSLFESWIPYKKETYQIMTSRGCPFSCTYCSTSLLKELYLKDCFLRRRSVKNVIDELKFIKLKYKSKRIFFFDDVFTINNHWLIQFCEVYTREINLPFRCMTHASCISEEILSLLKNSGCEMIQMGIQSCNDINRKNILNRSDTLQQINNVLNICKKIKLPCSVDYIFFPWEDEKLQVFAAKFFNETRPEKIATFYLSYLPRTKIINYAQNSGFIDSSQIYYIERGIFKRLYHSGGDISKKQLKMYKQFDILFQLIHLLSKNQINFIINKRLYRFFNFVPPLFFIVFKDLFFLPLIGKKVDSPHFYYVKYYFKNFKNVLTGKYF